MPPPLLGELRRWLGASLHRRLVAWLLAPSVAVVGLTALAAFARSRQTLRDQVLARLATLAQAKESQLTLWVEAQRSTVVFLAGLPTLRRDAEILTGSPGTAGARAAREDITALLDSARASQLNTESAFLLAPVGGAIVASTDSADLTRYRLTDLFYTNGLVTPYVQNVYASPITGRPTMTIAAPVHGRSGRVVGVLAGNLDLTYVERVLAEGTGFVASGEAYLVTPHNDFVSVTRFNRADLPRGVHSPGVSEALAGRNGAGQYLNYAGVEVLGAWRWIGDRQLALMVEVPAAAALAPARQVLGTILGFGLAAVLAMAAGIVVVSRRVTRPVLSVAEAAERVAAGDFAATAPVLTDDEVGTLARTFNDMTVRLRTLYTDLTEQIGATGRAYRALEESQQLLQAFVDNSANLIVVLDSQEQVLLLNRRVEQLLGVRRIEAQGRAPPLVLPGDLADVVRRLAREALHGAGEAEHDSTLMLRGQRQHYHFTAFPLAHPARPPFGVGIIGADLSERVRAEEEHRRLEAGVQQAQKLESLGLLAGGVAHDFNNILTAIIGGAALALDQLEPNTQARGDLEQVVTAAERAAKLTRQMLAYAGRASFAIEVFDLNTVIREMAELIKVSVAKTVHLVEALAEVLPPVRADRTQASQIVLNLVTNAAEATAPTGGVVRLATRERAAADLDLKAFRFAPAQAEQYVELTVADTGVGMDAETKERMFDPFYSTKGSGRGLGLAAVLGIVRQSGGTLGVQTTPGGGTTFTVLFPAATGPVSAADARQPPGSDRQHGHVLVVDDEDAVRRLTARTLERAGYVVSEASNGQEAVERFAQLADSLTAIVLDVTMPVMSGAEAFRLMRARGPVVATLVVSGYDQQDAAHTFAGDAVAFLQKPYRPDQILARLQDLLARPPAA